MLLARESGNTLILPQSTGNVPYPVVPKEAEQRKYWRRKKKQEGKKQQQKNPLLLGMHWALNSNEDYPSELEFAMYHAIDIKGL